MQFHYHQREQNFTLKKSVQQKRFFFDKSTNHLQELLRDKRIQFRNGHVIGRCWISDITCFSEEIEDFAFYRRGCHVVLRNSLDLLKLSYEQQMPLKIRKHHSHRIQLNDENFINYQEGTLNGQANKLILANSIFIEEMNSYIVENKIFPMGLLCEPPVNYQKVRCIKISDDTFCLQRINQQQCLNILIQRGKQIPFYNEVYCLEGQLSYVNGHFLFYHNGNLTLLNEHGIEYQEKIEGNGYLDGSEIFILQDVHILETHQNKCINLEIKVEGKILKIDIITTSLKAKMLLEENKVPLDAISQYLIKTNDYKYIKHKLKKFWEQKVIQREQLLEIYQVLTTLKKSNKVKGRSNLLRCYDEEFLDKISLENCLKSKTLNIDLFIQLFQNHIIYNYVHFLNMLIKSNPELLQYFLPNNQLFQNYEPNEIGQLCRTNKLKDLAFLGTAQIPKIQTDYRKIASTFLDKCYGQFTYSFQIEESDYFLYSLLTSESQSRKTFREFQNEPDKIFILLQQSQQIETLFNKLNEYYKKNNLNWYDEMTNQLGKSAYPVKIFQTILNDCPNLSTKQYLNSINLTFDRVMNFSIEHHKHFSELADLFSSIKNCFEEKDYEYLTKMIFQLQQASYLSQIFCNFNVLFQLSFIINKIMIDVNECHKSLEQILDHYLINRVKSTSFQFQDKQYNFQNISDLRNCLVIGFKNFIKDEKKIEALIFKKNLDFGKYRESKQLCTTFNLSLNQLDDALAEAMFGYLSQQKKVDYIDDERKKFLEIINEIEKIKKQKAVKSRKAMSLYKFVIISKEIGEFRYLDQFKCNQILFSLYRRTQSLDYPYLTMKKKLAKANDLKVYDREFCKFMLELAQKNFSINIQKAQLILDDLSKNGDEITQQESSIQLLQFSKDENQKQEAYWKVLKQSQSADSFSILLNLYKSPQQQVLKPLNVQIISREIIDVPVDTTVNVAKFEIEYLKFYSENLLEVVFLDTLLKDPQEAFFLIKGKETPQIKELIKRMACNPIINSEKLLTYFLKNLVSELNIQNLLQGQDKEFQDLAQALVLSQHKKIFSDKKALFDKNLRQDMIIERLEQLELDNIIPELAYFQDLDIKNLKSQIFYQKIQKTNLRDYYLNQEQKQIQSYVKNQIKSNPELIQTSLDLRYHFIIYEQIYGFTKKEQSLVRGFINQCILSPFEKVKHYDRIYKQIIKKEFDFNQIKDDFQEIIESENTFIIFEIVKYFYKGNSDEVTKIYCLKLLSDQKNIDLVKFWLNQRNEDKMKHALVQTMKEQSKSDRLNNYFKALQV